MFLNREKELARIREVVRTKNGKAKGILVWGIRRSGKSTLIKEAMKSFDGIFINMECAEVSFEKNMEMFSSVSAEETGMEYLSYIRDFNSLLKALDQNGKDTVVLIDEYQFMKNAYRNGNFDSFVQIALDSLSERITIILCGSYVSVMKRLGEYSAPLYGRFSLSIELHPFNYYEASMFYPSLSPRDKIAFYAVFGGLPFVLSLLESEKGLEWNIRHFLLDRSSPVYIVLTETLLTEIFRIEKAQEILLAVGNGKKRNRDLASALNVTSSVIADECQRLCDMGILEKEVPINVKDDRKKTFYSIKDNLLRFFYGFIQPNSSYITRFGADYVWARIEEGVKTFISRRFEGVVTEYVTLCTRNNSSLDVLDIGTYWYDSKDENIEYDVVVRQKRGYFIISCKYLAGVLSGSLEDEETEKMKKAKDMLSSGCGFASVEGYERNDGSILRLTGVDYYSEDGIRSGEKLKKYLG